MPVKIKIWDKQEGETGGFVDMFSLHAREALANDPKRYSKTKPGTEPKSVDRTKPVVEASDMPISEDWASKPWHERKKMALELGAEKNVTSDIANALISAELKRREKAAALPVVDQTPPENGAPADAETQP